jgi:DNA-binding NarL/FixJ family response regulator
MSSAVNKCYLFGGYGGLNAKLLIVDDNSTLRATTRSILESNFPELRIFEAGDGKEAFAQIHDHLPQLILMDIRLPGENGLKLTRKIKAEYPKIVVVIFTNHDLPEYREAAFESGAEFFLSKSSHEGGRLTSVVESVLADA